MSVKLYFLCFIIQILLAFIARTQADENFCVSVPTQIHITKEDYDELGRLVRSCSGEVTVNKCEGTCGSQVQPSVTSPTGFIKECFCCRENYLRDRVVTLQDCYDPDGLRMIDEERASMEVRLKEPAECNCYKCGEYSR